MEINPKLARVWELAEPIALEAGLEIVDIEHRREGRGAVLRLLIDKPGGVSLEDLTSVSRQVSDLLDAHEEAVRGTYTLEVSSPGVNRPLTRPQHFVAFVGRRLHVRTREPLGGRHSFRGLLESVGPAGIVVSSDDRHNHTIPFDMIARANYQHEFPASDARRGGAGKGSAPAHRPARGR